MHQQEEEARHAEEESERLEEEKSQVCVTRALSFFVVVGRLSHCFRGSFHVCIVLQEAARKENDRLDR